MRLLRWSIRWGSEDDEMLGGFAFGMTALALAGSAAAPGSAPIPTPPAAEICTSVNAVAAGAEFVPLPSHEWHYAVSNVRPGAELVEWRDLDQEGAAHTRHADRYVGSKPTLATCTPQLGTGKAPQTRAGFDAAFGAEPLHNTGRELVCFGGKPWHDYKGQC
jgi:hypothetical protein